MKLTIVGTEIDEAIKAYVANLITIKEGMVITVELKATRGPDGATAEIDISPAEQAQPVKVEVAEQKPAPRGKEEVKQVRAPEPKVEDPELPTDKPAEDPPAKQEAAVTDSLDPEPQPAVRTSLFGGMKKPVNE